MSTAPAGWHPDPSNPSGPLRWWDGLAWTHQTQPAQPAPPAPVAPAQFAPPGPPSPYAPTGQFAPTAPAPVGFAKQNQMSLTAAAVVVVYVILALASGVVLLGIFPVLLSIRAVKRKEPLAPVAVIAAVVAVGVALLALA